MIEWALQGAATLNAVTAASKIGGPVTVLVAGAKCDSVAKEVSTYLSLVIEDASLAGFQSQWCLKSGRGGRPCIRAPRCGEHVEPSGEPAQAVRVRRQR
jgi:hypothetical protein